MSWKQSMQSKHEAQIRAHEKSYGAPLGEALAPPTKARLDKDFEERKRKGDLFTQTTKQKADA